MNLGNFLSELRRRRVFRVTGLYAIVAWLVVQVAATTFPVLMLPDWTVRFVIALFILGIPVVVVLAWMFDITPAGIERTRAGESEAAAHRSVRSARRLPVGALAVLLLAAVGMSVYRFAPGTDGRDAVPAADGAEEQRDRSVAVLPFADFSAGGDQEWFSDGLTEELLNALAQVPGLRIAARTSSFAFKGQNVSIDEVARQLNVTHVVEGSVRRSGERLRITAQLVAAADGYQLWSQTFDRRVEDIFDIQEEISRAIAGELRGRLGADVTPAKVPTRLTDPETYDLYLRGRHHWQKGAPADQERALELFHQAIARDSSFVLAWVGLADSFNRLANWGHLAPREMLPRARAAAQRAVELDSMLAAARATFGHTLRWWDHDRVATRRELLRALELQPDYVQAHEWYAWFLADEGSIDDAIARYRRVVEADPLSLSAAVSLGAMYNFAHRWEEAIAEYDRALRMPGNPGFGARGRAYALYRAGRVTEAIAALEAVSQRDPWMTGTLGHIYAATGRPADARRMRAELERQAQHRYVPALAHASVHVALGDYDAALAELERGWQQGSLPPELNVFPEFEPIRSHPRFRALLGKLGFETGRGEQP